MKEPQTPEEWQEVCNMCNFYLLLNDARLYGLVSGGPEINLERCEQLFKEARRRGFYPTPGSVERMAGELAAKPGNG